MCIMIQTALVFICLRLHIEFTCAVYFSHNSSDYKKFFGNLSSKVEHILPLFPFAEISILGDFEVWVFLSFHQPSCVGSLLLPILHDLVQLVQLYTCIPDHLGDTLNILHVFLACNHSAYIVNVSSPLGYSGHIPISVSCPICPFLL